MKTVDAESLEQFLVRHGVRTPYRLTRLKAGRNSEVFHVEDNQEQWIVKNYFRHALDARDRLGTEYRFLQCLQAANVAHVALPVGIDEKQGRAMYSFLPGKRPTAIGPDDIRQAVDFIVEINRAKGTGRNHSSSHLVPAADACFSWRDHVALLDRRIARLFAIDRDTELAQQAYALISEQIAPFWESLKQHITDLVPTAEFEKPLGPADIIMSPSDFGFHNVLASAGTLYFVDFEYAGTDDAAKLICDFICQPECPPTADQGRQFCEQLTARLPDTESVRRRVDALLPLHRVKWCCILLNEFCAEDRMRRVHAGHASVDMLAVQLDKTRKYFFNHLVREE